MIMAREDGDGRKRRPASNHPWRRHRTEESAPESDEEPRVLKVAMAVTRTELVALRSRAGCMTLSQFLRQHFPTELLKPQPPKAES
jgi:hypothetical protein